MRQNSVRLGFVFVVGWLPWVLPVGGVRVCLRGCGCICCIYSTFQRWDGEEARVNKGAAMMKQKESNTVEFFFRSNKQRVGNVWSVCEGEEGGVNRLNNRGIISELFHCCLLSSRSLCLGVGVGNKDKTSLSALQPCHGQCVMPNWTHTQSQSGHILLHTGVSTIQQMSRLFVVESFIA